MKYIIICLLILSSVVSRAQTKPAYAFKIQAGTYNMSATVLITENIPLAREFVMLTLDSTVTLEDFTCCHGKVFWENGREPILWLYKVPETIDDHAVAAHELFHLTYSFLYWAQIPLTLETEEAYGHLIEFVSRQFYGAIHDIRQKILQQDKINLEKRQ